MKRLFVCATAVGLFLSVPASAADDHHGGGHAAAPARSESRPATHATHESGPARSNMGSARRNAPVRATRTVTHDRTAIAHQSRPAAAMMGASGPHGTASRTPLTAKGQNHGNSSVSAVRTGQHASVNSLRLNVQASHQFHDGNYRQPAGYQTRRWSYGDRLPQAYFARDYWLTDYVTFGLFAPPDGLVWVRVGDDALLIDEDSGDVVQVDYGVFY
jgi:Ni/Co efflux regulator RcnB